MDDDVRAFGTELGRKALAQEWAGVQAMLAPWLRNTWSVEKVQGFFEDEYRATLQANGAEESHHPEYPEPQLDGNGLPRRRSFASRSRSRAGRCVTSQSR